MVDDAYPELASGLALRLERVQRRCECTGDRKGVL